MWMFRGFRLFNRVQEGWSKVKTLFVIQSLTVVYLLVHEFTTKSVAGYFLLMTLVSYGSFLTFSVMIDSMQDDEMANRKDGIHLVNKIYRVAMHLGFILLAISSLYIEGCR